MIIITGIDHHETIVVNNGINGVLFLSASDHRAQNDPPQPIHCSQTANWQASSSCFYSGGSLADRGGSLGVCPVGPRAMNTLWIPLVISNSNGIHGTAVETATRFCIVSSGLTSSFSWNAMDINGYCNPNVQETNYTNAMLLGTRRVVHKMPAGPRAVLFGNPANQNDE